MDAHTQPATTNWPSRHDSKYHSSMFMRRADGFGVGVIDQDSRPLPLYRDNQGGLWVAGRVGQEYKVEIMVPEAGRFGALLTVDGANQIDGRTSSGDMRNEQLWLMQSPDSKGKNVIPGWLHSAQEAAQFRFGTASTSYVAQTGQGVANTGIIGCRFAYEVSGRARSGVTSRNPFLGGESRLGTEYGQKVRFETKTVDLKLDHGRTYIDVEVRYAPEDELIRAGFRKIDGQVYPPPPAVAADPFPGEHLSRAFAPAPGSWTGR